MEKSQYTRVPIYYSLAYHSLSFSKENPNYCAKDFLEYLEKVGNIVTSDVSGAINSAVLRIPDEKVRRDVMQAINLQLTSQAAMDLFPSLNKFFKDNNNPSMIDELMKKIAASKVN